MNGRLDSVPCENQESISENPLINQTSSLFMSRQQSYKSSTGDMRPRYKGDNVDNSYLMGDSGDGSFDFRRKHGYLYGAPKEESQSIPTQEAVFSHSESSKDSALNPFGEQFSYDKNRSKVAGASAGSDWDPNQHSYRGDFVGRRGGREPTQSRYSYNYNRPGGTVRLDRNMQHNDYDAALNSQWRAEKNPRASIGGYAPSTGANIQTSVSRSSDGRNGIYQAYNQVGNNVNDSSQPNYAHRMMPMYRMGFGNTGTFSQVPPPPPRNAPSGGALSPNSSTGPRHAGRSRHTGVSAVNIRPLYCQNLPYNYQNQLDCAQVSDVPQNSRFIPPPSVYSNVSNPKSDSNRLRDTGGVSGYNDYKRQTADSMHILSQHKFSAVESSDNTILDTSKTYDSKSYEIATNDISNNSKQEDDWDFDGFGGGVSMIDVSQLQLQRNKAANVSAEPILPDESRGVESCKEVSPLSSPKPTTKENENVSHAQVHRDNAASSSRISEKHKASEISTLAGALNSESKEKNSGKQESGVVEISLNLQSNSQECLVSSPCSEAPEHNLPASVDETFDENTKSVSSANATNSNVPKKGGVWRPFRHGITDPMFPERQVKSLLNKLTIEKFPVIVEKLAVIEDSIVGKEFLQELVDILMDKAFLEPEWSEMYADVCEVLYWRSPEAAGGSRFFHSALISKVGTEYETAFKTRGVTPDELEIRYLDAAEIEFQSKKKKKHILGVVKLIGELFQRDLLSFNVVQTVVINLVVNEKKPDEHCIECFLQLIYTAGYFIEESVHRRALDFWFGRLRELQQKEWYSKRLKCVMQDVLDLRKSKWLKKIHREQAKALKDLHVQLENEQAAGGSTITAQYGKVVVVGKRTNYESSPSYAGYIDEQRRRFKLREDKATSFTE